MSLGEVINYLQPAVQELAQDLASGSTSQAGSSVAPHLRLGLRRAARLPVLASLYRINPRPLLLLTDRLDHALVLADELALWLPDVPRLLFPEPTPLFYEQAAWGENTRRERLAALTQLASYHIPGAPQPITPPVIIATARALMTRTLPRRDFLKASRSLRCGQSLVLEDLVRNWVNLGYEHITTVIAPGQFARRGGILDIWPMAEAIPLRLEFFGDELETLRPFDPATQRTHKGSTVERVLVTPAREFLPGADPAALPSTDIGTEPAEGYTEFHLPLLHPYPASLLDYLPRQALTLLEDVQALAEQAAEIEEQAVKLRADFIRHGTLPEAFPVPYLSWSELGDALSTLPNVELGPVGEDDDPVGLSTDTSQPTTPERAIRYYFNPGPRFGGRLKPLVEHLQTHRAQGELLFMVSRQIARLSELWSEEHPEPANVLPPSAFMEGSLGEGWVFSYPGQPVVHLLTDGEIFGWRRPELRRRQGRPTAEAPEAAYADLQPGDWVVHSDHGIGQFLGLVRRPVDGVEREFLAIQYADDAQLYVPIYQADRVTRYVGPDGREPNLSRLGGTDWRATKEEVKAAVEHVAEDLLELYAQRSLVRGYAFSPDTAWQEELEGSFPYVETDDQLRVLAEVKLDMESERPMDRLICGDVGYGKTEVALRAAFKAVNDGKQVAILVPTTVLAQQHFHTFQQRLAAFPVQVEMLSRFRTPQQQRDILAALAQGGIDILIGTHRLLSSDVAFKDLGLLIIDEEQRFGVTHKERLKKMRTEVDVLTLTATPIPRTLYMALSGVRDISTINTPPEERLPIVTHVGPYSPRLVRQALLRELERGGQIFFVHNRVQTILAMHKHLKSLVPEARIGIAHGQMPEHELEVRMDEFTGGEVDVLLSTSIIESGLDIPNANTLIVDRADTFGLAQLYQLRGRVGRGAQRAYAYFFRHNRKLPTLDGRQRLETIAENTQLGAGFSIAMRDLEIRGTGDILGTRQSGHIAAVGFHLYTRLLGDAVRRLRRALGEDPARLPAGIAASQTIFETISGSLSTVNVELPLAVNLPVEYVPDKDARLGLYRRLAGLRSQEELEALAEEFSDRFGPPPESVHNLFYQLKVRLLAESAGLAAISVESGQIVLRFPDDRIPEDLPDPGPGVRVGKIALWLPYLALPGWRDALLETLKRLVDRGLLREAEGAHLHSAANLQTPSQSSQSASGGMAS